METIAELTSRFPRPGNLELIFVRPARRAPTRPFDHVSVGFGGLAGDHRDKAGPRAVTLIQAEHLAAIAALAGMKMLDPALLRRNLVISGINLMALKDRQFRIGSALLEGTGICAPCSRMEEMLGEGGYNAMRGHGGITASVLAEGVVRTGDPVHAIAPAASPQGPTRSPWPQIKENSARRS
jgi:MOSC domain-containing protein YiiM